MSTEHFTPQDSLELIEKTIKDARSRFEESGGAYIFWGILIALSAFGQFYLLQAGYYKISWYPYLIMPVGGFLSFLYYAREKKQRPNPLGKISGAVWFFVSLNIMTLAFAFNYELGKSLSPIILILLAIATCTSAAIVRSRLLLFSGIVINISGMLCFFLEWQYHSLVMGILGVVAVLIPGFILQYQSKRKDV